MEEEIVECDLLCAGGGIAGLMAAIRAREAFLVWIFSLLLGYTGIAIWKTNDTT
jgi:succinate dehydrogenase/fumarate reductase flavoprotein subunit